MGAGSEQTGRPATQTIHPQSEDSVPGPPPAPTVGVGVAAGKPSQGLRESDKQRLGEETQATLGRSGRGGVLTTPRASTGNPPLSLLHGELATPHASRLTLGMPGWGCGQGGIRQMGGPAGGSLPSQHTPRGKRGCLAWSRTGQSASDAPGLVTKPPPPIHCHLPSLPCSYRVASEQATLAHAQALHRRPPWNFLPLLQ